MAIARKDRMPTVFTIAVLSAHIALVIRRHKLFICTDICHLAEYAPEETQSMLAPVTISPFSHSRAAPTRTVG